ncbi:hypothetical protein SULYE_0618 [Sulfurihydrogenibium yellowstonense SS-5]|uniref:Uncharacterized protein n=1 Tax=Sulfurihydrogenibium yellowstonense SS-5 TaxID=432331 RepID=C4FJ76_9AQUI|nr:hypothetical protein SULYE_0618 [Sulfurihydrogenibium yellowstonense SS-5]
MTMRIFTSNLIDLGEFIRQFFKIPTGWIIMLNTLEEK